jgi:hypothetical protein
MLKIKEGFMIQVTMQPTFKAVQAKGFGPTGCTM